MPLSLPSAAFPEGLLAPLLAISLTGVTLLRPLYNSAGILDDFATEYLNPAGQRLTGLPERPGGTLRTHFPHALAAGIVPFYRRVFETGQSDTFEVNYQADGLDNYFHIAAQRHGEWLVVSFTDTTDGAPGDLVTAVPRRQAEQPASRLLESPQNLAETVFAQAPTGVWVTHGPNYVFELVNPPMADLMGYPADHMVGRPYFEVMAEFVDQGVPQLFQRAWEQGEPIYLREYAVKMPYNAPGEVSYFTLVIQPLRDERGHINRLACVSTEVTDQVRARQQVQTLNEELAAINEELRATNEEYQQANTALGEAQQQLQRLNAELEGRVAERTQQLAQALEETQRQREQLRLQQGHLQHILGQVPASVAALTGSDHRYTFFNDRYQALSGQRTRLGLPVAEVFPEVVEQGFINLLDQVYATGVPFVGVETPAQLYDEAAGQPAQHYVDFIYQPLRDDREQTTGILAFIVDVTEKVQARQQTETLQAELLAAAQRQARERDALYQVFEQTPAMIQLLRGPNHHVEYVNPAYQRLFPGRPLVGLDLAEAVPELREQGFIAILDDLYQTGETHFGLEVPLLIDQPDGQPPRTGYFTFTYQPYREMGQTVGISLFAHEVSEQVLARQEREAQRQRLHNLFMQAPAAICILDGPELVYELVNPGYQALFPGRDLLGKPLLEALPEIAGHTVHRTFRQVYETGTTWQELGILIPVVRPDGVLEDRYFNYIQQARYDAQGHVDGVLVFAFEVTDQVQARQQAQGLAQELTTTNQQLTRTNVDLDNFIYTASHDLKAPISNLEGLLYLLQAELPAPVAQSEVVAPTLTLMLDAVERFKRTIDHLTEVSKLQKEHAPTLVAVALAAVVEDVRQDLAPLLRDTNAELNVMVADFPAILFSEKNLRSVVYNLLSNALKYRHPDRRPHVDVQAHVQGRFTVLEVHDNGLGLDSQHLAKLFTMFQRFHSHVEGTGIGLFMVKRMVENAGGRIEVHSQLGAGTTFFVYLPHAPGSSAA